MYFASTVSSARVLTRLANGRVPPVLVPVRMKSIEPSAVDLFRKNTGIGLAMFEPILQPYLIILLQTVNELGRIVHAVGGMTWKTSSRKR